MAVDFALYSPKQVETESRKDSMVGVWVGKQGGPELEALARREEEISGHRTTKSSLARELLTAAIEVYRRAGSLSNFKAMLRGLTASQSVIQQSLETDRKVLEAHARTKPAGRKKAG